MNILSQEKSFYNLDEFFFEEPIQKIEGKIYKITNLLNGKIYIGQTKHSVEKRYREHCSPYYKNKQAIHLAILKYGKENFVLEQLDTASTVDELNQKEYEWIVKEDCIAPKGYNLRAGGMQPGISEETRKKRSENGTKGKKSIYNPITDEQRFIYPDEEIPYGFYFGVNPIAEKERLKNRLKFHKNNVFIFDEKLQINRFVSKECYDPSYMKSKRVKRKEIQRKFLVHNPETNKRMYVKYGEPIPNGFIKGRGKSNRECSDETRKKLSESHMGKDCPWKYGNDNVKGRTYYHNPETNKVIMIHECDGIPDGFIKGRGTFIRKKVELSEEQRKSMSDRTKVLRWFTNPETGQNLRLKPDGEIPDGFILGHSKNKKRKSDGND